MAEAVVNQLETVDVQIEDGKAFAVGFGNRNGFVQLFPEQPAVGQTGQIIVVSHVSDPVLHMLAFRQIPSDGKQRQPSLHTDKPDIDLNGNLPRRLRLVVHLPVFT
ncbi:hypothetical protein D3C71_2014420 [compost metagenome]